jgi:hypothetical protein
MAPSRYYAVAPSVAHFEKSVMTDELKRREREAKERAVEAQMLDSLYQVSAAGMRQGSQACTHGARSGSV